MAAIRRETFFNLAAPGASTNIFSASISPKAGSVKARITVALNVSGLMSVNATDSPPTAAFSWPLNGGVALAAGSLYTFEFGTDPALSYNVQLGTDGIVGQLLWDDIIERP